MSLTRRGASGFTLIEIMVAMAIIGIVSLGLISGIVQFSGAFQKNSRNMQASQMAQGIMENYRRLPDTYFAATGGIDTFETGYLYPQSLGMATTADGRLSDAAIQELMPGMMLNTSDKALSTRTNRSLRDIAAYYLGLRISDTKSFASSSSAKRQPRPPKPLDALTFYNAFQRVRAVLQSVVLDIRVVERRPVVAGQYTIDQAAPLGHVSGVVVRNPKQVMDRTGADAMRAMANAQSENDLEPVPYSESNSEGVVVALPWNYDFTNKKAYFTTAPSTPAIYQLQQNTPPLTRTDWVNMVDPSDPTKSVLKTSDYLAAHALGLTIAYPNATLSSWTGGRTALPTATWYVKVDGFKDDSGAISMIRDATKPVEVVVSKKGYEAVIPLVIGTKSLMIQPYVPLTVRVRQLSAPAAAGTRGEVLRLRFVY